MRAQESAVFEVMLGAFLLGMVLVMAYFVISRYSGQTCDMEAAAAVKNLAVAIENVANGDIGTKTSIGVKIPLCHGASFAGIKIVRSNDREDCRRYCETPSDYCVFLEYVQAGFSPRGMDILFKGRVCLRIPYTTEFPVNATCPENFVPVDPTAPPGPFGYLDVSRGAVFTLYRPPSYFPGAVVFCVGERA